MTLEPRRYPDVAGRIGIVVDTLGPFVRRPTALSDLVELLRAGARLEELEERAAAASTSRGREIGVLYCAWSTDFDKLSLLLNWTRELETLMAPPIPVGLVDRLIRPPASVSYADEETALAAAVGQLPEATIAAAPRFPEAQTPWGCWASAPFEAVQAWCDDLCAHADEASDWVEYRQAASALDDAVGAMVTDAVRAVSDNASLCSRHSAAPRIPLVA